PAPQQRKSAGARPLLTSSRYGYVMRVTPTPSDWLLTGNDCPEIAVGSADAAGERAGGPDHRQCREHGDDQQALPDAVVAEVAAEQCPDPVHRPRERIEPGDRDQPARRAELPGDRQQDAG